VKTCEYAGEPFAEPRSHPWLDAVGNPDCRYYDLTTSPAHIRTSLEDLLPWSHYPAIEVFYQLLERLNQRESALESNDCAFSGPEQSADPGIGKPLQCSGRLMVLFRALRLNTVPERVERLAHRLHCDLAEVDAAFRWGIIGTTLVPVRYLALPEGRGQQLGSQLMISFWAFGDSESDTMRNLGRLLENLSKALRAAAVPSTPGGRAGRARIRRK
jgi:hypothetical protein